MSISSIHQRVISFECEVLDHASEFIDQWTELKNPKYFSGNTPAELRVNTLFSKFASEMHAQSLGEAKEEFLQFTAKEIGMRSITPLSNDLSTKQLATLRIPLYFVEALPQFFKYVDPLQMSCFQYAFLDVNEPGVQELFFIPDDAECNLMKEESCSWVFDKLKKWGYRTVPDLQVNDLVLYLDNGQPKHLGKYIGRGLVLSKPGTESHFICHHPVDLVWKNYGDKVAYYRKMSEGIYRALIHESFYHPEEGVEVFFHYEQQTTPLR